MDDEDKKNLSEADIKLIEKAAGTLMMDALFVTEGDATFAIGALSLALASAAVLAKLPLDIMLQTMTMHYTNRVMSEAAALLDGVPEENFNKPVPPKTDKDLN